VLDVFGGDGVSLKPLTPVGLETCETELFELGSTPDRMLRASQENSYITSDLLES
jgi:hypothetical protein